MASDTALTAAVINKLILEEYTGPIRNQLGRQFTTPIRRKAWWEDVAAARAERQRTMGDMLEAITWRWPS